MKMRCWLALTLAATMSVGAADDREAYNRRAAASDMAAFRTLDLNRDGVVTHDEVRGDLNFGPRFNDIDINRNGVVTPAEMSRYVEQTYGVKPAG